MDGETFVIHIALVGVPLPVGPKPVFTMNFIYGCACLSYTQDRYSINRRNPEDLDLLDLSDDFLPFRSMRSRRWRPKLTDLGSR